MDQQSEAVGHWTKFSSLMCFVLQCSFNILIWLPDIRVSEDFT